MFRKFPVESILALQPLQSMAELRQLESMMFVGLFFAYQRKENNLVGIDWPEVVTREGIPYPPNDLSSVTDPARALQTVNVRLDALWPLLYGYNRSVDAGDIRELERITAAGPELIRFAWLHLCAMNIMLAQHGAAVVSTPSLPAEWRQAYVDLMPAPGA